VALRAKAGLPQEAPIPLPSLGPLTLTPNQDQGEGPAGDPLPTSASREHVPGGVPQVNARWPQRLTAARATSARIAASSRTLPPGSVIRVTAPSAEMCLESEAPPHWGVDFAKQNALRTIEQLREG
jgi:hypothetical protein